MPVWINDDIEEVYARLLSPGIYNLTATTDINRMDSNSSRREKLTKILEREAGNTQGIIATSMVIWEQVSLPLARMIGRQGVASLFERCVSLQAMQKPWLPHGHKSILDDSLYTTLWESLQQQPPEVALAACIDLFSCFFELLSTLIGERLTMRIFLTGIPDDSDARKNQEAQS